MNKIEYYLSISLDMILKQKTGLNLNLFFTKNKLRNVMTP